MKAAAVAILNACLRLLVAIYYAFDIFLNEVTGGPLYRPLSYRWGKAADRGVLSACILCKLLNGFLGIHHCRATVDHYDKLPPAVDDPTLYRVSLPLVALTAILIYLI